MRAILQKSIHLIPWNLRTSIKRIPGVAWLQRQLLERFVEGQEFVHTVDAGPARGLKYPVQLPDDKGVWTGTYEIDFIQHLVDAVAPGSTCFDVGGWRGYCGGAMAVAGASEVVMFEPLPDNSERIRKLIDLNPELNLKLVPAAAGEADGKATFTVMDATSMGKLSSSEFQPEAGSEHAIDVDIISLDSWCEKHQTKAPDVIKIDVEGAEMMVLRGAQRIIAESEPTLLIEAHSRSLAGEVVEFLKPLGYQLATMQTQREPDGVSEPEVCHIVARRIAA